MRGSKVVLPPRDECAVTDPWHCRSVRIRSDCVWVFLRSLVSLYDTIDSVTEHLAFGWMLIEIIAKYPYFLWNLTAFGRVQKCPNRKRREEQEVYGCLDKYGNCHKQRPVLSPPPPRSKRAITSPVRAALIPRSLSTFPGRGFSLRQARHSGCSGRATQKWGLVSVWVKGT